MPAYLALCARSGGRFEAITLRPRVTVADAADAARALALHETAHERCFIAAPCRAPIRHEAVVQVQGA
jgi:organic hydroperoxide reductase OsmC/OhrA